MLLNFEKTFLNRESKKSKTSILIRIVAPRIGSDRIVGHQKIHSPSSCMIIQEAAGGSIGGAEVERASVFNFHGIHISEDLS